MRSRLIDLVEVAKQRDGGRLRSIVEGDSENSSRRAVCREYRQRPFHTLEQAARDVGESPLLNSNRPRKTGCHS